MVLDDIFKNICSAKYSSLLLCPHISQFSVLPLSMIIWQWIWPWHWCVCLYIFYIHVFYLSAKRFSFICVLLYVEVFSIPYSSFSSSFVSFISLSFSCLAFSLTLFCRSGYLLSLWFSPILHQTLYFPFSFYCMFYILVLYSSKILHYQSLFNN